MKGRKGGALGGGNEDGVVLRTSVGTASTGREDPTTPWSQAQVSPGAGGDRDWALPLSQETPVGFQEGCPAAWLASKPCETPPQHEGRPGTLLVLGGGLGASGWDRKGWWPPTFIRHSCQEAGPRLLEAMQTHSGQRQ